MFQTILVPLDGSPFAERALPSAIDLARRTSATLHVVLVHHHVAPTPLESRTLDAAADAATRSQEREYLQAIGRRIRAAGVAAEVALREGLPEEGIVAYVEEQGVDLVVMTTHGRGGVSRFWLGSVADRLIRRLTVPIVCLRPEATSSTREDVDAWKRVMIALDGSAESECALEPAIALAVAVGASVELLQVLEPWVPLWTGVTPMNVPVLPEILQSRRAEAERYLEEVAERFRARGVSVRVEVREGERVAAAILGRAAHEPRRTVIALGTHGRGVWDRALLGSVADKVLRAATQPVLVCRAPRAAEKAAQRAADGPGSLLGEGL